MTFYQINESLTTILITYFQVSLKWIKSMVRASTDQHCTKKCDVPWMTYIT